MSSEPTDTSTSQPESSSTPTAGPSYMNQNYSRTIRVDNLKAQIAYCAAHQYLRGDEDKGQEREGMRTNLFKQGFGPMIMMRKDDAAQAEGKRAVADAREHLNQLAQHGSFTLDIKSKDLEDPATLKRIDVRDFRKLLVYAHANLQIGAPSAPPDVHGAAEIVLDHHGQPEFAKDSQNPQLMTAGKRIFVAATNKAKVVIG